MRNKKLQQHPAYQSGFTIIELLVTILIIAVLGAITWAGVGKMKEKAKMVAEIGAAKNLTVAYQLYASEHNGQYMTGMDKTVKDVAGIDGKPLSPPHAAERYPFRLAPYYGYRLEGTILLKDNERQILNKNGGSKQGMYNYLVSTFPTLGMNVSLVGGNVDKRGSMILRAYKEECIWREAQLFDSHLLAFASAGTNEAGNAETLEGYSIITAPKLGNWGASSGNNPNNTGNVAFRHNGKAICAFLDGSVDSLTRQELADMRLWSNNARRLNDPNYIPSPN